MSESRKHIVFELWALFCFVSYQNASGFQIGLTRRQEGDYFNNPHRSCDNGDEEGFCLSTNSICYSIGSSKCCYCQCHAMETTFNVTNLRCAPDLDFRQGCKVKFDDKNKTPPIKLLDLTKWGEAKIYWQPDSLHDKVNSFHIVSMYSYHGGGEINKFLKEKRKKGGEKEKPKKKKDGIWESKIQWDSAHSYSGKVFKVNISYEIEKSDKSRMNKNDCFVFKSKGSTVVTFPTLPSPSTTEKSTTRKSTSTTEKPTSTTEKSTSTTQKPTSTTEKPTSTTQKPTPPSQKPTSPSQKPTSPSQKPTSPTQKPTSTTQKPTSTTQKPTSTTQKSTSPTEKSDEILTTARSTRKAPNNTRPTGNASRTRKPTDPVQPHVFTSEISSSSIAAEFPENERQSSENEGDKMVYIIVAAVAVVTVIAVAVVVRFVMIRKTKEKMLKKRESRANIIMSDINKNNINEDEDGLYTTLDKSTRNDESNYQALTLPGAKNKQPTVNAYNEKMRQIEGDYIHLDADNVYSTIDPQINDRKVGAKSNDAFDANEDERVYSILEQYPNQIDYTTPSTVDERVYSILETEPGQIAYPTPSTVYSEPADQGCTVDTGVDYVTVLDDSNLDYVTVLPPKVEPGQSDCSVYADLSEQRAGENEYQSLVRRKK